MQRYPARMLLAPLAAAVILLGACGDGGSVLKNGGPTTTDPVVQTTTEAPTTTTVPVTTTSTTPPTTVYVADEHIDATPAAHDRFVLTWEYQTLDPGDLDKGDSTAYEAGKFVCAQLDNQAPLENLEQTLQSDFIYTLSGAQAVIAAAVRDLCPEYGASYRTDFDNQITSAIATIQEHSDINPDVIQVGELAKRVCTYLDGHSDDQLVPEIMDVGIPTDSLGQPAPVKLTVRQVVRRVCNSHLEDLDPWWFDDSLPFGE